MSQPMNGSTYEDFIVYMSEPQETVNDYEDKEWEEIVEDSRFEPVAWEVK